MGGDRTWARGLLAALAGLGVGAGVVLAWARGPGVSRPPASADEVHAELARLREDLERETFARQILEGRLELLERGRVSSRGSGGRVRGSAADAPASDEGADEAAAEASSADEVAPRGAGVAAAGEGPEARPWFDDASLAALGMSETEIERLRRIWEEHELDRAYVRDDAIRGGYERSRRHREAQRALEASFREELGDETYDRVLYATGRPNRAVVRDVLGQSPAGAAGLERGDVIWRYDGALVLRPEELQRATAAGRPGELVPIEVIRDGEPVRLFVPRGPLGVRVERERLSPDLGG
ncbi:MAG TPA: PDZ domain-containing protein [Myxococcota bacterium]|nr:PDZ domain-containing protein [Myxococcota bacterium]